MGMHVLVVAFPAYGHLIPQIQLGRRLAALHRVTVAVSQSMVHEIQQRGLIPADENIKLFGIQDGFNADDYRGAHINTSRSQMVITTEAAIRQLISHLPDKTHHETRQETSATLGVVDAVIVDPTIAGAVAHSVEKGIPFYIHAPHAARTCLVLLAIDGNTPGIPIAQWTFMRMLLYPTHGFLETPVPEWKKKMMLESNEALPKASGSIINTFRELEPRAIHDYQMHPLAGSAPVFAVGPRFTAETVAADDAVVQWMNRQAGRSVILISFGSLAWLREEQVKELCRALEELRMPFIWSIIPQNRAQLPHDFLVKEGVERSDRLVLPWVPQKYILQHPATRMFLSHLGWNSLTEALQSGVPVVGWPLFADQGLNGDILEEIGVGQYVRDTGMDPNGRIVRAEEIVGIITAVSQGQVFYEKAQQWKDTIQKAFAPGGSAFEDFEKLARLDAVTGFMQNGAVAAYT